jgi:pimeloyl-ACP methyl ester carboxylesterase
MPSKKKSTTKGITRRDFAAITAAGAALGGLATNPTKALAQTSTEALKPLDLAEWSYFFLGVKRAEVARGTLVNGDQMYVEYWVPSQVRHPYPIVMVHGGGGQGTDWMGTPDGRRGWATIFLEEGYRVYVVDRPGHGRSPFHPDLMSPFPRRAATYEQVAHQFSAPEKAEKPYGPQAAKHTQWPGTGVLGDPTMDQIVPGQGGSFLNDLEATHNVWRARLAELFDKIGPAMVMSHSMGGPNAWIAGDVRPGLVKAMIGIEPAGPPFGNLKYGVTACKMTFDPPVNDASELKTVKVTPTEPNQDAYFLQAEPARKLKNLENIPAVIVTSEASYHVPYDPGTVAFLKQAGVNIEHIKLWERGIQGNAHFMMMEKNNREVLQPVFEWIEKNVEKGAQIPAPRQTETAMKLADIGHFWVGTEHKKMPYGTIVAGQMYVQYLIPQRVRHQTPIVLVHGGGGSMLHYMGIGDGMAGWAHYYAQEGYRVYLVDRPGHGRAPYHPDALGTIGPVPTYQSVTVDFMRGAKEPNKRWPGTGDVGDPLVDQFQAGQNAAPRDNAMAHTMWAMGGANLLDKIGPAIIQVHSAGGPFGYLVANERPKLVKAIVNVEGGGAAFGGPNVWGVTDVPLVYDPPVSDPKELTTKDVKPASGPAYKLQADNNVHKLKNLVGIPIVYVTAERSDRNGEGHVAFLKQAGCDAENLALKDRGILGNGHFMMLEDNRKQVFDAIQGWLDQKAKA